MVDTVVIAVNDPDACPVRACDSCRERKGQFTAYSARLGREVEHDGTGCMARQESLVVDVITRPDYDGLLLAFTQQLRQIEELTVVHDPSGCPWPAQLRTGRCGECAAAGAVAINDLTARERRRYDTRNCAAVVAREIATAECVARLSACGLTEEERMHSFGAHRSTEHNRVVFAELACWSPGRSGLFITRPAQQAQRWPENPLGNGTGKSYGLHALAVRLCGLGISCRYVVCGQLIGELQATFRAESSVSVQDVLATYTSPTVLLLDDVGTEPVRGEWAPSKVFDILNLRERAGSPTVVTSNFLLPELVERLGDNFGSKIVSRLAGYQQRALGGPDMRWSK